MKIVFLLLIFSITENCFSMNSRGEVDHDQKEIDRVIDHAKSIKGVLDIINYIQAR